MAWGRQRSMRPLVEGYGGGSGGSFLPGPGFPPPGRTRPPGAVPAPSGRVPPSKWTIPKMPHGQRSRPMSGRFQRLVEDKARLALKQWENFMTPGAPMRTHWRVDLPAGWYRCPTPDWTSSLSCDNGQEPTPEFWDWQGTGPGLSDCNFPVPWGVCPQGQGSAFDDPLNTTVGWPADVTSVCYTRRTPGIPFPLYDFIRNYRRPSVPGQFGPYPVYTPGRVLLPEVFEDPLAEPQFEMEKSYGVRPRVGALTGAVSAAMPGVEYAPGGPPGGTPIVHPPVPPRPPHKERKEPPFRYGAPGKVYGALTEAGDAAKCYIDAKGGDSAGLGTRGALKEAWRLANDPSAPPLDGQQFMQCMAAAQLQDAAIGRLSKGAAKAQNRSPYSPKRPGGYRGGGWGTRMH